MRNKEFDYKLSIGSAYEYEDLIAEIEFPDVLGVIISQENSEGNFELSVHSLHNESKDNFFDERNIDNIKIPIDIFLESIDKATKELVRLQKNL